MRTKQVKLRFSQRNPLLFGLFLIFMAVALLMGATAIFRSMGFEGVTPMSSMSGDKLGIVYLDGVIIDAQEVNNWIRELRDDETVKGVLLRINSPGGAIAPSQELYGAVRDLADVKPVVASFSSVAASGGYYAAAPCSLIVSNPGSLTASIGVKLEYLNFRELVEKWGIHEVTLASGKNKAVGSPFRELTPEQREQLMSLIMDMHDQFVQDVADARKIDLEDLMPLADGRAMTGRQALEAGLVDELGSMEYAKDRLMDLCQLPEEVPFIEGPPDETPFLDRILGKLGLDADSSLAAGRILMIR